MTRRTHALAAIISVALASASNAEEVSAADPLPIWPAFACFPDEGDEPFVVMAKGGENADIFSVSIAGSDKSAEFSIDAAANMTLQSDDGFYVFSLGEVRGASVWQTNPAYTGLAFDGTSRAGDCISLSTVRWNIMQATHGISEAILVEAARSESFQEQLADAKADLFTIEAEAVKLSSELKIAISEAEEARANAVAAEHALEQAIEEKEQLFKEIDVDQYELAQSLAADLTVRETEVVQLGADLSAAQRTLEDLRLQLASEVEAKLAAEAMERETAKTLRARERELDELRDRMVNERIARTTAQAKFEVSLNEAEVGEAEAHRQVALLNEQVATLRTQLGTLQAIIDASAEEDTAAQVRIQTLGSDLNAALARAASEARRADKAEEALMLGSGPSLERYQEILLGRSRGIMEGPEGIEIVGDRFVFSSEVLFPSGSADLSEEGRVAIANVAMLLLDIQNQIPEEIDWIIRVDGHTDNIRVLPGGEFTDNWDLSQARALSVVRDLVSRGLDPKRLAANGFGQFQPLNPANTAEARAQNRRIELKLTER